METDTPDTTASGARMSAPGNPCLVYVPREDATPEGELAALSAVYRYVLERHDGRKKCSKTQCGGEGAQRTSSQGSEPGVPVGERDG